MFGKSFRDEFLIKKDVIFLNNGSFGATPKPVFDSFVEWSKRLEEQPVYFFVDEYSELLENTLNRTKKFLGVKSGETAFIENTTSGINAIINSLKHKLTKQDKILFLDDAYKGIKNTLYHLSESYEIQLVELKTPFPIVSEEDILERIENTIKNNPGIKIAIFDHISSSRSVVYPIKKMVEIAKKYDITVIIDGAHAPGMFKIDIDSYGADYYVGNLHKWMYAPKSVALIWTQRENSELIHPLTISLNYKKGFNREFEWTGTKNPAAYLSVNSAIDFIEKIGHKKIIKYNFNLAKEATKLLTEKLLTEKCCPDSMRTALSTIPLDIAGKTDRTVELRNKIYKTYKLELPFFYHHGRMWFRISAQIFNELGEYELLGHALTDMCKV